MQNTKKLCVEWDDFQQNVKSSFKELREDREFADVTLVCQDGKEFEVHKNILAFSSNLFMDILRTRKHPHPLLYLSGVRSDILVSVLDFIYFGEAEVLQEEIEAFLAVAEELKLKGLTNRTAFYQKDFPTIEKASINGSKSESKKIHQMSGQDRLRKDLVAAQITAKGGDLMFKYVEADECLDNSADPISEPVIQVNPESTDPSFPEPGEMENLMSDEMNLRKSIKDETVYTDIQEMNQQIYSLISKSDVLLTGAGREGRKSSKCNICGKLGMKSVIMDHIEAHHINAIRRECDICGKSFKTRNALSSHKATRHKGYFTFE